MLTEKIRTNVAEEEEVSTVVIKKVTRTLSTL